ncbi:MAG: magnesium transporter [Pseudomonadales bacterium]
MLRHYFVSDDLDDLENIEIELEKRGVTTPHIHVLSLDDTATENHHNLHDVSSFMKKDFWHSGWIGAVVGIWGAIAVLAVTYFAGWADTAAGWIPFIFLSIIVLGFCTWEGGFIGIQKTNVNFKRFEDQLNEGKHIFFVDVGLDQEKVLEEVVSRHPKLQLAGTERGTPNWVMKGQESVPKLLRETLP